MNLTVVSNWKDRTGEAALHYVDVEVLHLIHVGFNDKKTVRSESLIELAIAKPDVYPVISQMDRRSAIWHVSSILGSLGFTRRNPSSVYWERA